MYHPMNHQLFLQKVFQNNLYLNCYQNSHPTPQNSVSFFYPNPANSYSSFQKLGNLSPINHDALSYQAASNVLHRVHNHHYEQQNQELYFKQAINTNVSPSVSNSHSEDSNKSYKQGQVKVFSPIPPVSEPVVNIHTYKDSNLKIHLESMVTFILMHMNKAPQSDLENGRKLYLWNPQLLQIYDKLIMKYYSAKKCKEDIVRYILRKAFKTMKANLSQKEKVTGKKLSILLCQRYFGSQLKELQNAGINIEKEDEVMAFFVPYQKNSVNRTMNTTFVTEIFSSPEFCEEYKEFLGEFQDMLAEDNQKKIDKLIVFLLDCLKKNCVEKLGSYNRLPWLEKWNDDTNSIAQSLLNKSHILEFERKRPKLGH